MKTHQVSLAIATAFSLLSIVDQAQCAALKTAEFTRVINDVRVMPPQARAIPAKVGDQVTGESSVATGAQSRAELRFPDKTLTRIGSNSVFRFDRSSRTVDLQEGIILLQVPKQIGGAKVRTAAVTAAVTGTTVMVEYTPNGYIKIIVLEGEVDVYLNDKPGSFRTLGAGDMLIMKPDAKEIPLPVQVDLERLQKTSKLTDAREFAALGNEKHLQNALQDQHGRKLNGELLKTSFYIPGRGTQVTFTQQTHSETIGPVTVVDRESTPNPPQPNSDNPSGGGNAGIPLIPGLTIINDQTSMTTNPHITTDNVPGGLITAQGGFYNPGTDGHFNTFFFGEGPSYTPIDPLLASRGRWSGFKFEELLILGNPSVNSANAPRNVILSAVNDITATPAIGMFAPSSNEWDLGSPLDSLTLASQMGSIYLQGGFTFRGTDQLLALYAYGPTSNVEISASYYDPPNVDIADGEFFAHAGADVAMDGARINADRIHVHAERDVNLSSNTTLDAKSKIEVISQRSINITNSSQLRALSHLDPSQIRIEARGGDVAIDDSSIEGSNIFIQSLQGNIALNNAFVSGDVIKAQTLSPNGTITIGGNTSLSAGSLLALYAEGSSGMVHFTGPASLSGSDIRVAGKTVRIDAGVDVNVSNPSGLRVFTDNGQFSNNTANGFGRFTSGGSPFTVNQQNFDSRPGL